MKGWFNTWELIPFLNINIIAWFLLLSTHLREKTQKNVWISNTTTIVIPVEYWKKCAFWWLSKKSKQIQISDSSSSLFLGDILFANWKVYIFRLIDNIDENSCEKERERHWINHLVFALCLIFQVKKELYLVYVCMCLL